MDHLKNNELFEIRNLIYDWRIAFSRCTAGRTDYAVYLGSIILDPTVKSTQLTKFQRTIGRKNEDYVIL